MKGIRLKQKKKLTKEIEAVLNKPTMIAITLRKALEKDWKNDEELVKEVVKEAKKKNRTTYQMNDITEQNCKNQLIKFKRDIENNRPVYWSQLTLKKNNIYLK